MKQLLKNNKIVTILVLVLIFILAFSIRAHLMKYEYIFGFDSYWHTRMLDTYLQTGEIPTTDPLAYYWTDGGVKILPVLYWTSGIFYSLFFFGQAVTPDNLLLLVKILPALFGALIAISLYLFMKEAVGQKGAIAAAFFAALVPSFVYRTMSGFFEEDALGFLWLLLGFYFLIKALKTNSLDKRSLINSVAAGLLFGLMTLTWRMFLMVPIVLGLYFVIYTIANFVIPYLYKKKINFLHAKAFVIKFAITLLIFVIIALIYSGTQWYQDIVYYVQNYLPISTANVDRVVNSQPDIAGQTIGEESPGRRYFGEKYNALIIFPALALLLIPYNYFKKRTKPADFLIFSWIILTLFMAFSKLKFTYVFGLPIAASAGYIFAEIMRRKNKYLAIVMIFFFLTALAAGTHFVETKAPLISPGSSLEKASVWINENLPEDTRLFNWWDQGHILTFFAKRKVIVDNTNAHFSANFDSAKLLVTEDEQEAYDLAKKYDTTHVIVTLDTLQKLPAIALYAFQTIDGTHEEVTKHAFSATKCSKSELEGNYSCVGLNRTLTEEEIKILPANWVQEPNNYLGGKYPMFIYRSEDLSRLYLLQPTQLQPYGAPESNKAIGIRMFLNDTTLTKFKQVYGNNEVKIYEVL